MDIAALFGGAVSRRANSATTEGHPRHGVPHDLSELPWSRSRLCCTLLTICPRGFGFVHLCFGVHPCRCPCVSTAWCKTCCKLAPQTIVSSMAVAPVTVSWTHAHQPGRHYSRPARVTTSHEDTACECRSSAWPVCTLVPNVPRTFKLLSGALREPQEQGLIRPSKNEVRVLSDPFAAGMNHLVLPPRRILSTGCAHCTTK